MKKMSVFLIFFAIFAVFIAAPKEADGFKILNYEDESTIFAWEEVMRPELEPLTIQKRKKFNPDDYPDIIFMDGWNATDFKKTSEKIRLQNGPDIKFMNDRAPVIFLAPLPKRYISQTDLTYNYEKLLKIFESKYL